MPRRVPNFSRTAALIVCLAVVFGTIVSRHATAQENPVVVLQTNHGSITIELLQTEAPVSVGNFLAYVNDGFYENTVFHRVIQQFMIQGGGMTADLAAKRTRPPIQNEARNGVTNARGTVAMARTNIVDSATAQFFINTADNARSLDHSGLDPAGYGYAVFGRVTEGMDVVDSIAAVQTQSQGPYDDVPTESVVIQSVTVQ